MNKFAICLMLACAACSSARADSASAPVTKVVTPAAQDGKKSIGAACTDKDGWQPPTDPAATAREPDDAALAVAVPEGTIDTPDLAPGVRYCLQPGGVFPYGYLTSNCKVHSDCPEGTRCDDMHCRLPCEVDKECATPQVCGVPAGKLQVRFCSCPECVLRAGER